MYLYHGGHMENVPSDSYEPKTYQFCKCCVWVKQFRFWDRETDATRYVKAMVLLIMQLLDRFKHQLAVIRFFGEYTDKQLQNVQLQDIQKSDHPQCQCKISGTLSDQITWWEYETLHNLLLNVS